MPEQLPTVIVHKRMRGTQVTSISFDFSNAPGLRDEAIAAFKRPQINSTAGLNDPTFEVKPDTHDLVITLGRPTSDMRLVDSLLNMVAEYVGYEMVFEARPTEDRPPASGGFRTASWKSES